MDFENFTERSKGFIQSAQMLALGKHHQSLQPEHLLKVLLDDREGLAAGLIRKAGGDPKKALQSTDAALDKIPQVFAQGAADQLRMSAEFARVVASASEIAKKAGDSFVTVERLLLALALASGTNAQKILADAGVNPESLNKAINEVRGGRTADSASAEQGYEALKKYTRDLTQAARDGKLDPVIGRDEEIRRTIQVASRASARQRLSKASRNASFAATCRKASRTKSSCRSISAR
jgi:ATP-dependent Clp protease ATP-binding subunit ClpB